MANNVSLPEVLVLDTAADNIVAASVDVYIRKIRLVGATALSKATLTDAGGSVAKISLSHPADGSDTVDFYAKGFKLKGLRLLTISGTGAFVYVYTDSR